MVGNNKTNFNGISVLFYFFFLGSGGKYPSIKKLEHALEDQIYHILRKSRVITNIRYEELGWYYVGQSKSSWKCGIALKL